MKNNVKRHAVVQPQDQSIKLIPLTRGQNTTVDTTEYSRLNRWNWYAKWSEDTQSFYAQRHELRDGVQHTIMMHRLILGLPEDDPRLADHINPALTLDNRHSNLRICDPSQSQANHRTRRDTKSGKTGVYGRPKSWYAQICFRGQRIHLGSFKRYEDAINARREAERKYFGEFAYGRHLPTDVQIP